MGLKSRRGAEFWRSAIDEQSASGLSVKQFCDSRALAVPSFYNWRRKLREPDRPQGSQQLVPVRIVAETAPPQATRPLTGVQVVTPSGCCLRLSGMSSDEIGSLVGAVEVAVAEAQLGAR